MRPSAGSRSQSRTLPEWLDRVSIVDLEVNGATVDLSIVRHKGKLSVDLLRGNASVQVLLG